MAVRKRVNKPASVNVAPSKQAMLWYVVLIIGAVVFALAYLWQHLPKRPTYQAPQTPIVQEPNQKQRLSCERAGGKWTDCGNPCHGQDVESCVAMCEPQCLCGGGPSYSCPVNTVCTNKISAKPGEVAIGVCRDKALAQTPTTTESLAKITASVDASAYPFTLKGSVMGTSTAIWWTAIDASSEMIGRGTIRWTMSSSASFEQAIFLSAMPTSTAVRIALTAGSPFDKIEVMATSTKLTPMTRSIYKDDPASTECEALVKESVQLPKTSLPYEATMRAALGDALLGFSVSQGVATIVVPPSAIFSDSCAALRIQAIAKAVTADFPTIKSLVITE